MERVVLNALALVSYRLPEKAIYLPDSKKLAERSRTDSNGRFGIEMIGSYRVASEEL